MKRTPETLLGSNLQFVAQLLSHRRVAAYCLLSSFFVCLSTEMSRAEIELTFEVPTADQKVSGIGPISGWAFSTTGAPVTVSLRVDDQPFTVVPCCVDRTDVAQARGPQGLNSGFGQIFNFNRLADGDHTFEIKVQDGVTERTASHKVSVVRPGGFEFLSRLDLVFASDPVIRDDKEIVIENVHAVEKGTDKDQEVTIKLAWQENTQTLGIIDSDNTTPSAQTAARSAPSPTSSVTQAAEATEQQFVFENPTADSSASGIGILSGWTFSPNAGAVYPPTVEFSIDGGEFKRIPCCQERLDVAAEYPTQQNIALQSGFGALFNFNQLTSDDHTIAIRAQDGTGAIKSETRTVTVVKPGDFEFLDQFDLSDADAFIVGFSLQLDNIKVRDKATQEVRTVSALYSWQESCQCFIAQGACGNGSVEPSEECDLSSLDDQTCQSLGFSGGTLSCTDACTLDLTACTGGPRLLATNLIANTVSVISTATNEVTSTIKVGKEPRGIAVNPMSPTAYVTNFADDTLSVIDTTTATVIDTIPLAESTVRKGPQGIAVSPDGAKIYVVNGHANSVSVVDPLTRAIIANIPVGLRPQDIALTQDGTRALVTNFGSDSVSVINTQTDSVIETITVGKGPDGIATSPLSGSTRAYVAHFAESGGTTFALDTSTNMKVGDALILSFQPTKVAFAPDGKRVYISNFLGDIVSVIDPAANTVLSSLSVADHPEGIAITPNGKRIYVALYGDNGSGSFIQVSSTISSLAEYIEVDEGPFALAIAP